jgi:hypothetical protein
MHASIWQYWSWAVWPVATLLTSSSGPGRTRIAWPARHPGCARSQTRSMARRQAPRRRQRALHPLCSTLPACWSRMLSGSPSAPGRRAARQGISRAQQHGWVEQQKLRAGQLGRPLQNQKDRGSRTHGSACLSASLELDSRAVLTRNTTCTAVQLLVVAAQARGIPAAISLATGLAVALASLASSTTSATAFSCSLRSDCLSCCS